MSLTLLIDAALKGTALLVLVFLIAQAFRRTSAAARHLLWSLALLGVIALPVLSTVLPWRVEILPARPASSEPAATSLRAVDAAKGDLSVDQVTPAVPTGDGVSDRVASGANEPAPAPVPPADRTAAARIQLPDWRSVMPVLGLVWLVGGVLVLARLVVGMGTVWWVARHGRPLVEGSWRHSLERAAFRLGIDQPVRLVTNPAAPMPFTTGFFRPLIVLPGGADDWSAERRLAVLLHELAHLRRGDFLTHLVAEAACALYWFHPLVWVAARKMRAESERACDDLVLRAGTRPSEYAGHLLDIVRSAGRSWAPAIALPMAQQSEFEGRLLAILEPGVKRHGLTPLTAAGIIVAITVAAIPLAAMGPAREAPPPRDEQPQVAEEPASAVAERPNVEVASEAAETAPPTVVAPRATRQQDQGAGSRIVALIEALGDSDTGVRRAAVRALGELQDTTSVLALMRALREDTDAEVRRAAAWALGELDDPRAIPALADALRRDQDVEVRRMAAWALGEIDDALAVPTLLPALRDADTEVRSQVAWALGEIESPQAVEALGAVLQSDANAEVRRRTAWALGEIEDPRAAPALGAALSDTDMDVRRTAIWALGEIEDASAIEPLSLALRDSSVEIRRAAVHALGQIEDASAVEALSVALRDGDVEVRKTAVWALGEIESPRAVPAVANALQSDASADVRRQAAWALGEIESRDAIPALSAAIRDQDVEVRRTAVWALGEIEDAAALDALTLALRDGDVEVRRRAVWALGEVDLGTVPPGLLEAATDEDTGVRKAAARAMGEIEDPAAVPALTLLMRDDDRETRRVAVWALSEIHDPAAYEALVLALKDEDPEIRRLAARALGRRNRE